MKILIIEDDPGLSRGISFALLQEGYETLTAVAKQQGWELFQREQPDAVLLDLNLPDGDGIGLCQQIRRQSDVPVLMLTARDMETDEIMGLKSGADDYITKPFKLGELCSRIRALLRRSGISESGGTKPLTSGPLSIDLYGGGAFLNDEPLNLTGAEYRLLCLLVRNEGQTVLRNTILDALWDGNGNFVDDNTLSVYIRRLREKIEEDPSNPKHLLTVRGFGYRWRREDGAI